VKLLLLEILIDSMFTILTLKDHNGMKFAVNKLKTIILLPHVLGNKMEPKLELVLFVDLLMFLMYALKKLNIKVNLNLLMFLYHKLLSEK
jgi:hypothetical protein